MSYGKQESVTSLIYKVWMIKTGMYIVVGLRYLLNMCLAGGGVEDSSCLHYQNSYII